ncbi:MULTISPECIES: tRNA (adenosine(37)-N6)-threonylcarbamoyltransferase complex dimerization subunit type 1 TsaB [Catenibacterium]|uniref:tRNA (adenosine(37)-N6)-threonylcarbamoyltransferase complex dimerization subunit type 1 TsaB n=1 Tax=Catenibacterium TaxID=135858 RepID=UPI0006C6B971|nr:MULTISPECIES: tRNA (adenosine(37)-N6)-threonylcarbamoyltransferase complex dimerization subunit type 1 TsaB [Catenibacterium]MEE0080639.1 tRNA (adenosine(37)-N6)-threonylcarbamoyltransferase complex dimerization subunit type 1 TsaB [Catenibacterium mitsuokai]CUP10244.1 UGMP family protein [Catenibacterium mitsuokai]CUP28903.1 UGMP family protein [Roseburia hominis]
MISLVMDTSNSYLAVGLFKDNMCLEAFQEKGSRRQSEKAIPSLKEVLDRHHIALKDVNEMIITSGPGSYTGVRVAMTIAKTLAAVSDVRIKSVSSLAAYAGMNQALSVIDARGHKVFVGVYENGLPLIKEQVMTLEDFTQLRAEYEDFELVGEVGCLGLDEKECDLCANIYALAQMADPIKNVDLLVPTYIKDVEAKKACY